MSWKEAQSHAEHWLKTLNLGKTKGQHFDIHTRTEGLPENEEFRRMVIKAARRPLKQQVGASV